MKRRRKTVLAVVGIGAVALVAIAWRPARRHLVAASLLSRFEDGAESDARIEERDLSLGPLRARRYAPIDDAGLPVVLLLHGVHSDGIEEPRLMRFARLLAGAGLIVTTPEIAAMREMRFDDRAVREIDAAAREIARLEQRHEIGVVGISFGAGLALIAASEEESAIGAVLAIGSHHDARRVARWWLGERIEGVSIEPERYGAGVLAYAYSDAYFEGVEDADRARAVLRARLEGVQTTERVSDAANERLEPLRQGRELEPARARLRAIVRTHDAELASVSPARRLTRSNARVFLIHGEGDTLIPSTESLRIARELDPDALGGIAITPLIGHADHHRGADWLAKLRVVHLMADALAAFESFSDSRRSSSARASTRAASRPR